MYATTLANALTFFSEEKQVELKQILNHSTWNPQYKWYLISTTLLDPATIPYDVHYDLYKLAYHECEDYESPAWFPNNYTITHNHNLTNPTPTNILKPTDDIHGRKTNIEQIMDLYNNSLSEQESHKKLSCYQDFYKWSTNMETCQEYWDMCIKNRLKIQFDIPYDKVFDFSAVDPDNNGEKDSFYGIKSVQYLSNARFNVADSCFPKEFMTPGNSTAPSAIVFASDTDPTMQHWSHEYLNMYANRVALSLKTMSVKPGDAVGICMPMSPESVAIYLGIVKAGAAVVSIADSFSAIEIQTRMNLSNAKVIFTQDVISRGTKILPLYTRILDAQPERVVVVPISSSGVLNESITLRQEATPSAGSTTIGSTHYIDVNMHDILPSLETHKAEIVAFESVKVPSSHICNILFSSGTTGEPKAIPWFHSTPIKSAIDGHIHQDIQEGDVVCWPTNLGWMMGPWILFQLMNKATLALYNGVSTTLGFMKFVTEAKVNMLGVVPSIVKAWKSLIDKQQALNMEKYYQELEKEQSEAYKKHEETVKALAPDLPVPPFIQPASKLKKPACYYWPFDWSRVTRFSSTGEASDLDSMLWLMSRVPSVANGTSAYAPVIEYCGGTEIAGSFLSSTLVQPNIPAMFSTPVCGSRVCILSDTSEVLYDDKMIESRVQRTIDYQRTGTGRDCQQITGEIALIPPSLGLSTTLLNRNHHDCYYTDMPLTNDGRLLRRHGDEIQNLPGSYFRALGRCDDTMNLGGIKVSSVEIERVCNVCLPDVITETSAIGIRPRDGGPSQLIMVVMTKPGASGIQLTDNTTGAGLAHEEFEFKQKIRTACQMAIKTKLNPLFHIHDVLLVNHLPRTASNKIMRRVLRDNYIDSRDGKRSRAGSDSDRV